jgi:polyisoprenoid-binding protein YceI
MHAFIHESERYQKNRMQRRILAIVAALVVIVLAAGTFVLFSRGHSTTTTHKAAGAATVVGTPIPTTGLTEYTLQTSQSSASYSVHEDLIFGGVGSHTAIGTSKNVSGGLFLGLSSNHPVLTQVNVTVDLTSLMSDSSLRDQHVGDYLDTSEFPSAQFSSTNVSGLPATYTSGTAISFQMIGNLKLHGVTNQATFTVQGKLDGTAISGTATTTIFMTDFGITPPDLANIAVVDNKVTLTISFTAQTQS